MKFILPIIFLFSAAAAADQFKTVTENLSSKNYESSIDYPVFFENSIPAYAKINETLKAQLKEYGCAPEDAAESEMTYDYTAVARVIGLNKNYVGIEVSSSSFCGGAHPNYGTYGMTFDSNTGELVDIEQEIPQQHYGDDTTPEEYDLYQNKLATLIYNNLKAAAFFEGEDAGCFDGLSKEETISEIAMMWPYVSGLAKDKKVVLRTSPAHVMAVCELSVRVPYDDVKNLIAPKSKLHKWLK